MPFFLSSVAEDTIARLDEEDPAGLGLVLEDLELLDLLGVDAADVGTMLGEWAWVTGPTGRVSYWITPSGADGWLIEGIEVY